MFYLKRSNSAIAHKRRNGLYRYGAEAGFCAGVHMLDGNSVSLKICGNQLYVSLNLYGLAVLL